MSRKVFTSFHYNADSWRASMIRNIGKLEKNPKASANKWEEVKQYGDAAVRRWIDANMVGRSCLVVLIGENTANRKWINYEIAKAWNDGKGVFGIYIHNLTNAAGSQANKGNNPFDYVSIGSTKLSRYARCYSPPYTTSANSYNYIKENIESWIETAINAR